MAKVEFITKERLNELFDMEEKTGRNILDILGDRDIDGRLYSVWQDIRTGVEYAVPEVRTVHMGFNSNEPGKLEEFVSIVEREGSCNASWGVTGRTMHNILGHQLAQQLPQYDWIIDDNYFCRAKKR